MKKRNGILARVGIVALVLTLVTSTMTSGTLAKYTSSGEAKITAIVAQWDVSALIGPEETDMLAGSAELNLMDTLSDEIGTLNGLETGKIAPGVKGSFDVKLDAGQSDVDVNYSVFMFFNQNSGTLPTNFVFKEGAAASGASAHGVDSTTFGKYLDGTSVPSVDSTTGRIATGGLDVTGDDPTTARTVTINWDWPETTSAQGTNGIAAENAEDTTAGMSSDGSTPLEYCIVVVMSQASVTGGATT